MGIVEIEKVSSGEEQSETEEGISKNNESGAHQDLNGVFENMFIHLLTSIELEVSDIYDKFDEKFILVALEFF